MPDLNPCDLPWLKDTPACKLAGGIGEAIDFAKDPLGYIAQKMQEAAAGLSDTVLPQLEKLTHPDLSVEWFRSAYSVSFALSLFIFAAFIGWNFLLLGRRRVSGDEVMETLGFYTPLFFGGTLFGPLLGTMLLTLTGAVTDSLITWGVAGSVDGTTKALQDAIAAGSSDKIVGGAIVAIIFFACLIVALLLAFLILLIMLVTLYLTGAIIPLSLVWLTNPRQRDKGLKLVMVWVGVCFSHVLLFLMLGTAFRMVGGLATNFDQPGMTVLANLAAATIALLMATLSPLGLLAFAPVGPSTAGGGGPSMSVPGRGAPVGGYDVSDGDSQTAQMARDSDSSGGGGDAGGDSGGGGGDDVGAGSAAGGGGGLLGMLQASRGGGSSSVMEPTGGGAAEAAAGGEDVGEETAGAAQPGADTSSSGAAMTGTSAADGATAMNAGADRAEDAGDQLSTAGQAATATGAGAPVGLAMQAAGEALKGTAGVVRSTAELAQSAGDMAAEHMEHGETHNQGGSGANSRPRR